jgi:hypothetical protein
MKYMRKIAGCTWTYYKSNTEIAKESNLMPVLEKYKTAGETGYNINDRNRLPSIIKITAQRPKKIRETIAETSVCGRDLNVPKNCPALC